MAIREGKPVKTFKHIDFRGLNYEKMSYAERIQWVIWHLPPIGWSLTEDVYVTVDCNCDPDLYKFLKKYLDANAESLLLRVASIRLYAQ